MSFFRIPPSCSLPFSSFTQPAHSVIPAVCLLRHSRGLSTPSFPRSVGRESREYSEAVPLPGSPNTTSGMMYRWQQIDTGQDKGAERQSLRYTAERCNEKKILQPYCLNIILHDQRIFTDQSHCVMLRLSHQETIKEVFMDSG